MTIIVFFFVILNYFKLYSFFQQYPGWQRRGTFVLNDVTQINPTTKQLVPEHERYVLYQSGWKKGQKGTNCKSNG